MRKPFPLKKRDGFFLLPAYAKDWDDATALDLVTKIKEAEIEGDFDFLANIASARASGGFRKIIDIHLDRLEETYSPERLESVTGFARKDLAEWSGRGFFRIMCGKAWSLRLASPEGISNETMFHLRTVRDAPLYHVLFRLDRSLASRSARDLQTDRTEAVPPLGNRCKRTADRQAPRQGRQGAGPSTCNAVNGHRGLSPQGAMRNPAKPANFEL